MTDFNDTFRWITDFLKDKKTHSGLKDLIPDCFDKYVLIPWTIGIIKDFPFDDYPENKNTINNLNKQHSIERQFGIFLNTATEENYSETTLKEIAERFSVNYSADTIYSIKSTPGTSLLPSATKRKLTELLSRLKDNKNLNLYI